MKFSSLYVTAHNMNRAVEFYKKLFSKEPVIQEERFSSFDLDGFGFDIFAAAVDKEETIPGNNTIPVFYTEDLNRVH
jgi:predicted enzyme related to lactoylglutathione lyase